MVFIHGGAFVEGSGGGRLFKGSNLAAKGDVVVVTINYRLGILGFLVYQDENVHGNFGLMDQHFALQWVQEHIESFGGDKNNITVFGESAGAMSIGFHLMMKNPVFNAAIVESNPYTIPSLTGKQADLLGKKLVENIGMSVSKMREMKWTDLQPMIDKAAEYIPAYAIYKWGTKGLICWKPVIKSKNEDKTYVFNSQPINTVPKKPLIIGTNKKFLEKYSLFKKPCEKMSGLEYSAIILALFPDLKYAGNIYSKYPPCLIPWVDNTFQLARVLTDGFFTGGNLYYMENADRKDLYAYYYTYVSSSYWYPVRHPDLCDCKKYVCHSAELPYVFHNFDSPRGKGCPDDKDKNFSDSVIGYWTNFAGDKKPGGSWKDWSTSGYLKLDVPQGQVTRRVMDDNSNYSSCWKPIITEINRLAGNRSSKNN